MKGLCPHCNKNTYFREFTFGEMTGDILRVGFDFFTSGWSKKISNVTDVATEGKWKNFKCTSCDKKVHTCGGCGSIEPYQDFGAVCRSCGYK